MAVDVKDWGRHVTWMFVRKSDFVEDGEENVDH